MIKSMTGWGQSVVTVNGAEVKVEIKSVNNRYLDCNVRLQRAYSSADERVRQVVGRRISRGKVDVFVAVDTSGASFAVPRVNRAAVKAYLDEINELADELGVPAGDVTVYDLLRLPDTLSPAKDDAHTETVTDAILTALNEALDMFDTSRAREGERLKADILERLDALNVLVAEVERRSPATIADYRKRLEARLREVLTDKQIDETRMLTEAALFAERVAVNEETVRLRSHAAELYSTLERGEPIGRRLDFLVQEANREANTIGSKANDAELAKYVVDLKAEIEKIREQAQNIE